MNFYAILQNILDEKGLNIPEAARACGLSDSTIRSIITRKNNTISLEVAMKIAKGLNVSLERLNGLDEKPIHQLNVNEESLQTNNREMFRPPTTDILDLLMEKYNLSDGDYVLIQNFINLRPEVRKNILEYCLKVAADISKNEDDYIPLTQTRMTAILQSLPKTPEELERQFPPVEFNRKKSDAG